jgi:hypothetical protein
LAQTDKRIADYTREHLSEIQDHFTLHIYANNDLFYYLPCKLLHRNSDLPAIIVYNNSSYWYKHGKKHRSGDKLAFTNAIDKYYQHGKLHRGGS